MRKAKNEVKVETKVDPSLPYTAITIGGAVYKMCFDYGALAKAEDRLISMGHQDANLLFRMPHPTFSNMRVIFAASLLAYQPDIDFEEAKAMVTPHTIYPIMQALYGAWNQSLPDKEPGERPHEPEQ